MREIKFRFWSGKKMFYDIENSYECLKQQIAFNNPNIRAISRYDHIGLHGADFMQYTGLKDKNGKELYEGDIVKIDAGYGGDNYYKECIAEIKYNNDESCFYPHNYQDKYGFVMQDYYNFSEFEIIGNIYENPELLKESHK